MDPIYLIIVVLLLSLAALDLMVGVSNDAVNFLNSSIGSKVAPLWVILTIASIGVMFGAMFSSGMMEIARSGVFHPEMLTFPRVITLFLAVMITDVVLLDLFNTLGLPTSTTVSLVFELLGSAVAVSLFVIMENNGGNISEYINTAKALAIISGIFISVAIAFITGSIIMYVSRLIFSFRYKNSFKYFGAFWGGIALTAITYFAVFKGLKNTTLIADSLKSFVENNMLIALLYGFLGWTVIMAIVQHIFRVNILKIIVLSGTFTLALAFASNDLVNFIGVPMAALSSYQIASDVVAAGGSTDNLFMDQLNGPVLADWRYLGAAGLIMVLTLWFSKKSRTVTETEVNLARQHAGLERFSSSALSRSIVRMAVDTNSMIKKITPKKMQLAIEKRFMPSEEFADSDASFDLIRASVNLTIASLLISIGTSLKLPLSTTYVTFMVAMGTSLADRAWGRESAVYRITGVLTVIGGWLITAFIAFTISFIVALFLVWGGKIAIFLMIGVVVFSLIQSAILHRKRIAAEKSNSAILETENEILRSCTQEVIDSLQDVSRIYEQNMKGLIEEDRKLLRKITKEADKLYEKYKNKRTYEVVPTIQSISLEALEIEQEYVQVVDYTYEIAKALRSITKESYRHIDNNHKGFVEEQVEDLNEIGNDMASVYRTFITMMDEKDYAEPEDLGLFKERIINKCAKMTKKQIKRVKANTSGTRTSILFLHILNETKLMALQSSNLIKSQQNMVETVSNKI